jgi:predicted transcriptional regulator
MKMFKKQAKAETVICPSLGPLELDILKLLWKEPRSVVRGIMIELNKNRSKQDKLAYTTVMTIMRRLMDKGLLTRTKESRSYIYAPTQPPHEFISKVVDKAITEVVELYGDDAISAFKQRVEHL